jgi:hypothetical protein
MLSYSVRGVLLLVFIALFFTALASLAKEYAMVKERVGAPA